MDDTSELGPIASWEPLIAAIRATDLAAVLLQPPHDAIIAASPAAGRIVGVEPAELAGRGLEEFFGGWDSGGLELLARGTLSAYETRLRLRATSAAVQVWVRLLPVGDVCPAVAVLLVVPAQSAQRPTGQIVGRVVAVGSVSADMTINNLASDVAGIAGVDAGELIGTSMLTLVEPADAGRLLGLIASASANGDHSAQAVRARMRTGGPARCEVLLVPNTPDGGYAFTIMDIGDAPSSSEQALHASLQLLPAEARSAAVAGDDANPRTQTLLGKLAGREVEVVTELLNGNRVPAIAGKLFLSPGTVRNHLSTAFHKLGVASQQELIDLLRCSGPASTG